MESVTKQRLIGAIVLIALAVIFLPLLVKGPAPDSGVSDVSLKVPNAPEGQFVEIPLNAVGEVPAGGVVGLKPGTPAPVAPSGSEAIPPGADAAAPASDALPAAVAGGDYAVNFGAYATPADAAQVVAMLKKAQLPGFSESATINGKSAYRVRIGPYADRAQAEIVRLEAVKVRSDVNAQVVTLDAPNAAPATTASTPQSAPVATVVTQPLPPEPRPEPAKPAAAKPEPAKPVAATPNPAETKPAPTPAATVPAKPVTPAAAPASTAATAPAKPAATGYAVQVGAFANAAEATAQRDRLRALGFSAFVEQVNTDKGVLNRVRAGPVATREAADQLKSQVAAKAGISGQVRPHP